MNYCKYWLDISSITPVFTAQLNIHEAVRRLPADPVELRKDAILCHMNEKQERRKVSCEKWKIKALLLTTWFKNYKRDSNSYCSIRTIDDYQKVENYLCKGNRKVGGGGGASGSAVNEMILRVIINLIPHRMTLEVQGPLKNRRK